MAKYILNKTIFNADSYEKAIDTSFSREFTPPPPLISTISVSEFFKIYDELFYTIPASGVINSHEYLIQKSSDYIQPSQINEDTQLLLDEITSLRQDLLTANQTILDLQISSSFNNIPTTSSFNPSL
jgi:hypothetical protein